MFAFVTVAHADEGDGPCLTTSTSSNVTMWRLYNQWSGEHLYTSDSAEYKNLGERGWTQEGEAWLAPQSSSTPVYRLYNPYSGDHHFTTNKTEYDDLGKGGWSQEGVGWYSADSSGMPIYRLYNPYESVGTHHFTKNKTEYETLSNGGWSGEGVTWYGVASSSPLTAKYTVTFNSNGGSSVAKQTVESGKTATKPTNPTKNGYTFDGWYSDSALTKSFNFSTAISANTTLYAKWKQTETVYYTVTFNLGVDSQTVQSGQTATKPKGPYIEDSGAEYYDFVAWFEDKAFTKSYNFNKPVTSNLTLYAKWQEKESLPKPFPPEGYVSVYRLINQTTGYYFYTTSEEEIASKVSNDWVNEGVVWYTPETSNSNLRVSVFRLHNPNTGEYYYTVSAAERNNLVSAGWNSEGIAWYAPSASSVPVYRLMDPNDTYGKHFFTTDTSEVNAYVAGGWTNEGVAFYGEAESPSRIVTFNSNGGNNVPEQVVETGKTASKPDNPTKDGQTFVIWCTDEGLTMPYNFSTTVTDNITLYAK